jgi:fatty-acyl-CoA synthase
MRLHDYVDYWGVRQPDAFLALHDEGRLTYRDARLASNRLANALLDAGIEPGDRIAILSKNCPEYLIVYLAASRVGAAVVPMNYRLAPPEWEHILADAGPRVVFAGSGFAEPLQAIREADGEERTHVALHGSITGWESYGDWQASGSEQTPESLTPEDAAILQLYTSGTTGRPKGALITHRALSANLLQISLAVAPGPGDRHLGVAPLFHAAVVPSAFTALAGGGSIRLLGDFEPERVLQVLSDENVTCAVLVAAMIQACVSAGSTRPEREFPSLRLVYYGASPIATETLKGGAEMLGCGFVQSYGMSEATQAVTFLDELDHRRALGGEANLLLSAGRPALGTRLRIVDLEGAPLPQGSVGEIAVRGPQLMSGYWQLPEETATALRGGWLHTGDVGSIDESGYLFVQDRVKDMIVTGGENVYPRVVEEVLYQHPAVAEAAVIGVPDDRWGETVKAVVVLKPGMTASDRDVMDFCVGKLGGFERPRSVDIVSSLPRNASGKVLKRELREPYWAGRSRRVAGS